MYGGEKYIGLKFLSTPSARRATVRGGRFSPQASKAISIHALREEGDPVAFHLHGCRP